MEHPGNEAISAYLSVPGNTNRKQLTMNPAILLADDHIMLTKGLISYLKDKLGYKEIGVVTSCNGVLKELKRRKDHIGSPHTHLVLDIALADGSAFEILETLNNLYPDLRILIFSSKPPDTFENALRKYRVQGYLPKNAGETETMDKLRKFFQNEPMNTRRPAEQNPFSKLTAREQEILHYLVQGKRLVEIASLLNVGTSAIGMAKANILEKTGAKNLAELVTMAVNYNLS